MCVYACVCMCIYNYWRFYLRQLLLLLHPLLLPHPHPHLLHQLRLRSRLISLEFTRSLAGVGLSLSFEFEPTGDAALSCPLLLYYASRRAVASCRVGAFGRGNADGTTCLYLTQVLRMAFHGSLTCGASFLACLILSTLAEASEPFIHCRLFRARSRT